MYCKTVPRQVLALIYIYLILKINLFNSTIFSCLTLAATIQKIDIVFVIPREITGKFNLFITKAVIEISLPYNNDNYPPLQQ